MRAKFVNLWYNVISLILGIIYGRDRNVILFGSWMGNRFSDNSRYLFQYLHFNKRELGLKDVIWATRDIHIYNILRKEGYHTCLIGTSDSKLLHLKAGTQILCNMAFERPDFQTDIDTKYSFGAKKIQLWHGVGMKSVGFSSNEYKQISSHKNVIKKILHSSFFDIFNSLGAWGNATVLATSEMNATIMCKVLGCSKKKIVITGYPRNCECLRLSKREQNVIDSMKSYRGVILYLPTFRSSHSSYKSPITDTKMINFIEGNNILWLEKPHLADLNFLKPNGTSKNVHTLESDFDTNVLYSFATIVISDYSSVVFDAIYRKIPVIMYTPDLDEFKESNVGFLFDIRDVCKGLLAFSVSDSINMARQVINDTYFNDIRCETYRNIFNVFWGNSKPSYSEIWEKLHD